MIIEYNLQFFAKEGPGGEKTEPATEKKIEDARKKGQVAKSKEIYNAVSLLALFLMIKLLVGTLAERLTGLFNAVYDDIPTYLKNYEGYVSESALFSLYFQVFLEVLVILAPVLGVTFIAAILCDVFQVKWKPTLEPLKPKFDKLNPISGFKKIFNSRSLFELLKSLIKLGLICWVVYSYLKKNASGILMLYDLNLYSGLALTGNLVINLGIRISLFYFVVALIDLIYQKWKFKDDLKMTKQEVKDEYKQSEGDPQIKGKIKRRMMEASQRRMMQALPEADVVITNPTHYAVAIKYDSDKYDAPIVLAKGADYLAQKIKEIARENNIEIVENKPLARTLYANVEVGELVPPELYQAVAEVLAFVYHLKGKNK